MYDRPSHFTSRSDSVKLLEAVTKPELVYSFKPFTSHTVFRNIDMEHRVAGEGLERVHQLWL